MSSDIKQHMLGHSWSNDSDKNLDLWGIWATAISNATRTHTFQSSSALWFHPKLCESLLSRVWFRNLVLQYRKD